MTLSSPPIPFSDIACWMAEHPKHVIVSLWLHAEDLAALRSVASFPAPEGSLAIFASGIQVYWGRDVLRGTVRIVAHEAPLVEDIVAAMDAIRNASPR